MSRMIDADALFAVVKGHHDLYKGAINPADKARRNECLQMMCDITDAPTIDAIPVEWLRRWRDVTDIPLLAMNIDSILKVWEESNKYWGEVNKKQEAR